ncbi:MAG: inositol monophosphatase family protein [Elusimicrobiota bacterium]
MTPRHVAALVQALRAAGRIIRRFDKRPRRVSYKGPVNLVTEADKAADREILRLLKARFPGHNFLTEESIPSVSASAYRWIIDPLDGTTNFAHGIPHAAVSIGLEKNGRMVAGGILDPFKDELFLAVRGRGARLNGRPIRVSRASRLIDSLLVTGFPYDRLSRAAFYVAPYEKFLTCTQEVRRLGAAALDLAYVACGRFDGYWEYKLHPWDAAAGWLIVEEAGGKLTDYRGRPFAMDGAGQTLCSNGRIHGAMVRILRGHAAPPRL